MAALGVPEPSSFPDLANPKFLGTVALADPSKSGSAAKAFEMIVQQQMAERLAALETEGASKAERDARAPREGWQSAMRLIRRIGANARYFTDSAAKIPLDVAAGDAAVGTCIDFYGRFQSESAAPGGRSRMGFVMPRGGTSVGSDPIGLLRGAPHRELAYEFLDFVLSEAGQKIWNFKVGTPGGPERYALRRLPILPSLYAPAYAPLRSDPEERPYEQARSFTYRPAWTGPLFRVLAFLVRVMCVDTEDDLKAAYRALVERGFPPAATAAFDDVADVDYAAATGHVRAALASPDPRAEAVLANDLVTRLRARYRRVVALAREGD
jgi:ABC-type glycerol-3-phosphate transport system substrate-binding protein